MRFNSATNILLIAVLLVSGGSALAQKTGDKGAGRGEGKGRGEGVGRGEGKGTSQGAEAVVTTTETVNVSLTTGSGRISVRGWDRSEVRAQTRLAGTKIEMRGANAADAAHPVGSIEILVSEKSKNEEIDPDSEAENADSDVRIEVPRGAIVYLKTRDGDIEVDDIAEAHIETTDGRIEARRISKAIDAGSVGGHVALEDASGRARLSSLGGVIEARDLRPRDAGDFVKIRTASGDILLDRIGQARVEATTISGEVRLMGSLARGATYDFKTTTGDVTLILPATSSFKLSARISEGGEIITEFPLKYKGTTSPFTLLQAGRLFGTYGSGDATINLVSFNGTLRLRKQ